MNNATNTSFDSHINTLKLAHINELRNAKIQAGIKSNNLKNPHKCANLLAFSGGTDSVALFFSLLNAKVDFDIAIVDYGLRAQSKAEVAYAKELATKYNKQCFIKKSPKITANFEAEARNFRYEFFECLIADFGYENLVLAHHFNDKAEWLFMQLSKGAGLSTMLGFEALETRQNGLIKKEVKYNIIRPMLSLQKRDILDFCDKLGLKFFIDSSNADMAYKRNFMRHQFADFFVEHFGAGLQKSIAILTGEKRCFYSGEITDFGGFWIINANNTLQALHCIDNLAKQNGYVLSFKQREEIVRCGFSCEVGGGKSTSKIGGKNILAKKGFVLERLKVSHNAEKLFMGKKCEKTANTKQAMPKDFREFARKSRIPKRMRKYLYAFAKRKKLSYKEAFNTIVKES